MLESEFKKRTIGRIQGLFEEDDLVFISPKSRSLPDVIILGFQAWAALEFKRAPDSSLQPNQAYHIDRLNNLCYASFVRPENVEGVLDDLEKLFTS